MRIVLDTNVVVVMIGRKSIHQWLYAALRNREFELAISTEIMEEYMEILIDRHDYETAELTLNTFLLLPNKVLVPRIYFRWNQITTDPDDNKFVDCAIAANADYIITEDRHFRETKGKFPPVTCLKLEEFKQLYFSQLGRFKEPL